MALGRLMAVDGQRDPIKVVERKGSPKWRLVTGRHRLRGAELEGIPVYALEVIGKAEELADLEASENLHRRPLGPIERAKFTAALVQAAQERIAREHGNLSHQKLGAKARWDRVRHGEAKAEEALRDDTDDACAKIAQAYGWEESVGEALGMSRRTIHNDLSLFRLLVEPFPRLIEALSRHPVVGENAAQLKAIAQVREEARRRQVIEALLANAEIGAEDARIAAGVDLPARPRAGRLSEALQRHLRGLVTARQGRAQPVSPGIRWAALRRREDDAARVARRDGAPSPDRRRSGSDGTPGHDRGSESPARGIGRR